MISGEWSITNRRVSSHVLHRVDRANADLTIANESLFRRLLVIERKRSERTGQPFMLMVVQLGPAAEGLKAAEFQDIALDCASMFRETDVIGWYPSNSALGVILTCLNGADLS